MERSLNAAILKIRPGGGAVQATSARLNKACVFGCEELRDLKAAIARHKAQAGKGK